MKTGDFINALVEDQGSTASARGLGWNLGLPMAFGLAEKSKKAAEPRLK